MPGIGIITNPHAKLNKRKPQTAQLLGYILGEHGRLAITNSLEDLGRVAGKFRDSNIEILAINGGDGTISRTLSAFFDAYQDKPLPLLALLRGGTMNVLANNLGVRGSSPKILFRLCEAYSGDLLKERIKLHCIKVNGQFGFLYADGIAYTVLDDFYQNKTGSIGAAWHILKLGVSSLFKGKMFRRLIQSKQIDLSADDQRVEHESLGAMASTLEKLPFSIPMFRDLDSAQEKFQYLSVRCTPEEVLFKLPSLVLLNKAKNYRSKLGGLSSRLSLKAKPGYTYSLDGELFSSESGTVDISIGPQVEFIII